MFLFDILQQKPRLKEIPDRSFSCWLLPLLSYKGMIHFRTQRKPLEPYWERLVDGANEHAQEQTTFLYYTQNFFRLCFSKWHLLRKMADIYLWCLLFFFLQCLIIQDNTYSKYIEEKNPFLFSSFTKSGRNWVRKSGSFQTSSYAGCSIFIGIDQQLALKKKGIG